MAQQLGRYRIIETLGQGGMGTIHLAIIGGLGRFRKLVVLKLLREDLTFDPQFVELFMREAALAACLSHPNVVHTVEAGQTLGRCYLVMEFLDGQPFSELMRSAKREPLVPLSLRLRVLCDALAGLHYAHELTDYDGRELHLVHRDVSPPNIFVTYDGLVKLLDFGIARARDGSESRPGEFKGKIGYAAPEQLQGQPADRRIDVFAAGVVLWEAIALRHIAEGKSSRQTLAARLSGTEPRIAQVVPEVDAKLAAICDRAMATDPATRYSSAEEFRVELLGYLRERGEMWESAELSRFMREKFADKRAAMHQRIDAFLRDSPGPESSVTALIANAARASDASSAPTSAFKGAREASRSERSGVALEAGLEGLEASDVLPDEGRFRSLRKFATPSMAALALAISLWRARSCELSDPRATTVPTVTNTPAPAPAEKPRPPVREPPAPREPAPEPKQAHAPPERKAREDVLEVAQPPVVTEKARKGPRESGRRKSAAAAQPSTASALRDAAAELDLRGLPRRERRRIDVQNPFR